MAFWELLKARRWAPLFGYGLFIGMMAIGYYYNITFIQLGLYDLGTRLIGMTRPAVAGQMAVLAVITCTTALLIGSWMTWRGGGTRLRLKLRIACVVVAVQTVLTALAPHVRSEAGLLAWIIVCSLALGAGVPATFSMTTDLIPRRDRGYAAALITAGAYFMAETLSTDWQVEQFSAQLLPLMAAGTIMVGVLAFVRLPLITHLVDVLAAQHRLAAFARGRFVQVTAANGARVSRRLLILLVLMFGVFFVDSLGFLRLIETPAFFDTTWQSPQLDVRLLIAVTHVVVALVAGILYTALPERELFLWVFGIFALVHLMYGFSVQSGLEATTALVMPMLYAAAVSLYTVINFALWADVSTPRTIPRYAAIGVAGGGWAATFFSTSLAIQWRAENMPLAQHLRIVDSLAMLFFLFTVVLLFLPGDRPNPDPARPAHKEAP